MYRQLSEKPLVIALCRARTGGHGEQFTKGYRKHFQTQLITDQPVCMHKCIPALQDFIPSFILHLLFKQKAVTICLLQCSLALAFMLTSKSK